MFRAARRSADPYFTVLFRSGPTPEARLGLVVSRKAAPRAVARNRIKRVVRESFRQALLPPRDIVVIARPAARRVDSSTLRASLEKHWQRLAEKDTSLDG